MEIVNCVARAGSELFQPRIFRPRLKLPPRASHTYNFLSRPCVHGKGNAGIYATTTDYSTKTISWKKC